jgi:hypothetical protein
MDLKFAYSAAFTIIVKVQSQQINPVSTLNFGSWQKKCKLPTANSVYPPANPFFNPANPWLLCAHGRIVTAN